VLKVSRFLATAFESIRGHPNYRAATCLGVALTCLGLGCGSPPAPPAPPSVDPGVFRRAEAERIERLEEQIELLGADLRRAEKALVLAESGLRGSYSRADAVSALAESKIEAELVQSRPGALFVSRPRVNLRAGPTTDARIVQVLGEGLPVFPESRQDPWVLVRATSGSVGWGSPSSRHSILGRRARRS
jgi:hypothetical protein